ncbi:hypothetical protein EYF80_034954 [Liparis tanakae]|uniref:Uncharacterized protein n=1 Tax=Liparis tanakae TaxID=230148 RepID=A0A4Z2GNW2_9TELE|nr:hypothetical protein EYF80_034954 [Liparis tanakae]
MGSTLPPIRDTPLSQRERGSLSPPVPCVRLHTGQTLLSNLGLEFADVSMRDRRWNDRYDDR